MTTRCPHCGRQDWCNCALDAKYGAQGTAGRDLAISQGQNPTETCARGCTRRDRHQTDCPNPDNCGGCQPRPARYGVLCEPDHNRINQWLTGQRGLLWTYNWLGENISRDGTSAARQDWQRPGGKDGPPLPIRETIHDLRTLLSDRIYIAEERAREVFDRPTRDLFDLATACHFLAAWLTKIEEDTELVLWMWEKFDEVMRDASIACPWSDRPRTIVGIACPNCEVESLARYPGDENVTCRNCWATIQPDRYEIWTRMLAEEHAS